MIANDLGTTGVTLLAGLGTVAALMAVGLVWSNRSKKLVVVDILWGAGFVLVAAVSAAISASGSGNPTQRWTVLALVAIWGIRLVTYLAIRNSGKGEDPRYAEMAAADGRSFARVALARVFVPQGLSMWLVSLPVMIGVNNHQVSTPLWSIGVAVWAVGLFFESVGDAQLMRFKADPTNQGKVMDRGLWRYTRHPNYFGDACVWTGIWLISAASWPGLAAIISPIAMTFFLTKVTGAANNEKGMRKSKPEYEDYVRRTSGFIPLPPKK